MIEYSTIEEAWGSTWPPVRRKKKDKRPAPADNAPLDNGAVRYPEAVSEFLPWTSADMKDSGNYWPGTSAPYHKEESQRSDAPLPGFTGEKRSPAEVGPVGPVGPVPGPELTHATVAQMVPQDPRVRGDSDSREHIYDVILYVFTGIILILLLEQFVQMGVQLSRK